MAGEHARLREILSRPDTVLFVGAGVSRWSGLPSWPELIEELADFVESRGESSHLVRRELANGDLLQAASFAFELLTPGDRAEFLRASCRQGSSEPSRLHRRIATLGPRCFITTNFDQLLERALRETQPGELFQTVRNTDLVETASIIRSRALDFVFKPHGDVDAADSIVLTREQYRLLRSEKRYAYEALKTLLASRPVVFTGFGLRDPDFLLIKDTLANLYQGAAQDHYAIVPDVDEQERQYWRRHYGIHLTSYATRADATEPAAKHAELMEVLDSVAHDDATGPAPATAPPQRDDYVLPLLRQARRMAQVAPPAVAEILPIAGAPVRRGGRTLPVGFYTPFSQRDAVDGLRENRHKMLLTGAPGAGKTFAVRRAVAALAEAAIESTLGSDAEFEQSRIPAYVDLKDYEGDLWTMVVESFPVGFPLEPLIEAGRIAFFVDGLNEVPARIVEDNSLHADLLDFLERARNCSAVLATRFGEEHSELELPEIALDAIPREYVQNRLVSQGVDLATTSEELLGLLQRPVFYRLCTDLELWDATTPQAIYAALVERLASECTERFGVELDLLSMFGELAYEAIDLGTEAIPLDRLLAAVEAAAGTADPGEIANWLLMREVLVPRLQRRVSFFHHSVTEYLAGSVLARRFTADPRELRRCLAGTRWDHAVLLALGFLSQDLQRPYFEEVMAVDPVLGLRSLAFVDEGWREWTAEALRYIGSHLLDWEDEYLLSEELEDVRIAPEHEPLLLGLSSHPGTIGGISLARTLEFGGRERAERVLDFIFDNPGDSSRLFWGVSGLRELLDPPLLDRFFERLGAVELDPEEEAALARGDEIERVQPLIGVSGSLMMALTVAEIRARLEPLDSLPPIMLAALLDYQQSEPSAEGFALTADLFALVPSQAAVTLHLQLQISDNWMSVLRPAELGPLLIETEREREDGWALDDLQLLGEGSEEWREWLRERAEESGNGLWAALLWLAAGEADVFFQAIRELHEGGVDWSREPLPSMQMSDLDWSDHLELFLDLLRERDTELARNLFQTVRIWRIGDLVTGSSVELGEIQWWLDWLAELYEEDDVLRYGLSKLVATAADADQVSELLRLLADGDGAVRDVIAYSVLGEVPNLEFGQLSPAGRRWALDDLRQERPGMEVERSVLAVTATEEFVEDELLPLFKTAEGTLRSNLTLVLRRAGERHRRRYLTPAGEPLH